MLSLTHYLVKTFIKVKCKLKEKKWKWSFETQLIISISDILLYKWNLKEQKQIQSSFEVFTLM